MVSNCAQVTKLDVINHHVINHVLEKFHVQSFESPCVISHVFEKFHVQSFESPCVINHVFEKFQCAVLQSWKSQKRASSTSVSALLLEVWIKPKLLYEIAGSVMLAALLLIIRTQRDKTIILIANQLFRWQNTCFPRRIVSAAAYGFGFTIRFPRNCKLQEPS